MLLVVPCPSDVIILMVRVKLTKLNVVDSFKKNNNCIQKIHKKKHTSMTVKKSFSLNYHRIFHSFSLGQFLRDITREKKNKKT